MPPGADDTVTISAGDTVTLDGTNSADSLTIAGTLAGSTHSLTLDGSGTVWNDLGTFTPGSSTIIFAGTTPQSISGTANTDKFSNLKIDNATGVTNLETGLAVNGTLTLSSGEFTISGTGLGITLGNGATVNRSAGSLSAAPTFTTSVNLIYSNAAPITTGGELPLSTGSVLNNLTINGGSKVTLGASAKVVGTLSVSTAGADSLDLAGFTASAKIVSGNGTITNNGGATTFAINTPGDFSFGGLFTDKGSGNALALVKDGTGELTLTKANTYHGTTTINGGSIVSGVDDALPIATVLTVNASGTFDLNGRDQHLAGLSGLGGVTETAGGKSVLTVNNATANTFGGVLSGNSLHLVKDGAGTLTLTGTNTFSGPTTVNLGVLLVNGVNASSAVTLAGGALGGTGTVDAISATSGFVSPGVTGVGTLTTDANADSDLNNTTFQVDVTAAATSDRLTVGTGGSVVLTGSTLSINVIGSALDNIYTILSGPAGSISGEFVGLSDGEKFVVSGRIFQINYTSSAVTLTDVADVTTTTIDTVSPASPQLAGTKVTFSGTVDGTLLPGAPTGTVKLQDNGVDISGATDTLDGSGNYSIDVTTLTAGNGHNITAVYLGDTSFATSTSAAVPYSVNQAPTITSVASTTFTVGAAGTYTITTTGFPTGAAMDLSVTGTLPTGVTFVDNNNGTATLSGTPAAGMGGTYTFTITASNGIGTDATQSFTLTVNQAPAITSANNDTFQVGIADSFTITTTGFPTGAAMVLSRSGALPTGVTFVDNNNGTATLSGTPAAGTGGTYSFTITANNGVSPNATQTFTLTVNQPPAITSVASTTFTVGTPGTYTITTSGFPTGAAMDLSVTGTLPTGVTFVDNNNGTATLSGTPAAATGGTYTFTITASNGIGTDAAQSFTLTVNQAPAITSVASTTFTVGAAGTYTITTSGFPTGAAMDLSVTGTLPTGVSFVDNNNGTATLSGTPAAGTGGTYTFTITANNGVSPNATQSFTLTVNQAPAITSANNTTFIVGAAGSYTITTSGFPTNATLSIGSFTLPSGLTFTSNGNGTATLAGTPAAATGGTYTFTITASNGVTPNATQNFTLTVNQAPAITSANNTTFTVGTAGTHTVTTTGFPVNAALSIGSFTLPSGVTFTDNGNGTATLAGTPAAATGGTYTFTITANNGVSPNATQSFTLTVNQAPQITSVASTTFTVGTAGSYTITTSGFPTNSTLSIGSFTLPSGVTFVSNGNGTATLAGTPAAATGGTYTFTITASNGVSPNATQSFTLTVNQAPAITSVNNATFTVGTAGSHTITTTGFPVNAALSIGSFTLPSGVTFTDNGNGTATLAGTPAALTGGVYTFTITANNGVSPNATQNFTLTVNQAPAITSVASTTFTVGTAGSYTITTTGFPAAALSIGSFTLPSGLTFTSNGNGTATLAGTPAAATGGVYTFTITASNGIGSDATQNFTLTVNQPPAITSVASTTFTAGAAGSYTITTTGFPTNAALSIGSFTLPSGVTFTSNGDGTATLAGTPGALTGGVYTFTIAANNGVSPNATQNFTLTVNESPQITSPASTIFTIGSAGTFTISTTGFPNAALDIGGFTLPSGVTFTSNGDGTATLAGTPAAGTTGVYTFTITASNGVSPNATQPFTFTVGRASTTTTVSDQTAVFGSSDQNVPLSATVTSAAGAVNQGTVTFTIFNSANVQVGAVTSGNVSGGTASATYVLPANTPSGVYSIRATYTPGPDFTTSSDTTHTLTVDKAGTTTLAADQTAVFGSANQNVTLSATVTATTGAGTVNQGTVSFTLFNSSNVQVGTTVTSVTVSGGVASVTYVLPGNTPAGTYTIRATYNAGTDYTTSLDTAQLTVGQAATATLAADQTAVFGSANQNVTLSATVTATTGTGLVNQGTVSFTLFNSSNVQVGTTVTSVTVSGGAASVTYVLPGNTPAGTYTIRATYNAGTDYTTSLDTAQLTVGQASTTTLAADQTAVFGSANQNVTLSATVTATTGAGLVNQGTVSFTLFNSSNVQVGTTVTSVTVSGGAASVTYVLPGDTPAGTYTIRATYNAGADYTTSLDTTHTLTVGQAATATVVGDQTAVFNASNQNVTLSATVTATTGAGLVNQGTVSFTLFNSSNVQVGATVTSVTVSGGAASVIYVLPGNTPAGTYRIEATYNAGADYTTSLDTAQLTVGQASTTTAPTTLNQTFNIIDQTLTLTGTVTSANGPVNGGTLTFTITGIGTVTGNVSGNTATATITLPAGRPSNTYAITTTYSGSANFLGSSDTNGLLTVTPRTPLFDTLVTPANASGGFSTSAQSITLSAIVTTDGGSTAIYEGTVTFTVFKGSTQIGTAVTSATVNAGNASAIFTVPAGTAAGSYTIFATYNQAASNPDFNASIAGSSTLTLSTAGTTTTVVTALPSSLFGQSVTYTATVVSTAGAPSGIVTFVSSTGTTLGNAAVNSSGQAILTTPNTLIGANQTITATFFDALGNFGGSSGVTTQTVAASRIALTVDVTAGDDIFSGDGLSLREAIGLTSGVLRVSDLEVVIVPVASTVANQQQFVINFSGAGTIAMSGSVLALTRMPTATSELVTIDGTVGGNAGGVTISGADASAIFDIASGIEARISMLTLADGKSAGQGGAISNRGDLTLNGVTIASSTAASGGGIYNAAGASLTLTNSTITGNSATTDGGGIYNAGSMSLTSVTISGNDAGAAGSGGGIFTSNLGTLRNTIVAGNLRDGSSNDVAGTLNTAGSTFNLIGIGAGGLVNGVSNNIVGVSDPNLGPLATNPFGGTVPLTQTLALLPGSAALNAGDPALLNSVDQRGFARTHSNGISIGAYQAADATRLVVVAPANVTAGALFTATVQAVDANGNAGYYTGTIDLSTNDVHVGVVTPPDFTFQVGDRSTHTFTNGFKLITSPSKTITATDTKDKSITGTATITVDPDKATTLAFVDPLGQPSDTTAGVTINGASGVVLVLRDQFGNIATNNTSKVTLSLVTLTDLNPYTSSTLRGTKTQNVVGGFATFTDLSIREAGSYQLSATDGGLGDISDQFDINPAAVTHFQVSGASVTAAGALYSFTVTAEDQFGNRVTTFPTATAVTFTSANAPPDMLPGASSLTGGTGSFTATLNSAGANFITATAVDPNNATLFITGTVFVNVNSQPTELVVTTYIYNSTQGSTSSSVNAGDELTIIITAYQKDPNNPNGPLIVNANFSNTIHFSSSDPQAVLPTDYTFTVGDASSDNGVHAFGLQLPSGVTVNLTGVSVELRTSAKQGPGAQTITASDAISPSKAVTITVSPLAADHLGISFPAVSTPGAGGTLVVSALDLYGNIDPTYVGIVELSVSYSGSTPGTVTLPAPFTFTAGTDADNGTRGFALGLPTVGSYTFSATGTMGTTTITGSSTVVVVPANTASALVSTQQNVLVGSLSSSSSGFVNAPGPTQTTTTFTSRTTTTTQSRDVIAVSSQAPVAVEAEVEGDNPAISLLAANSVEDAHPSDAAARVDEVYVDESLLPVMASRRGSDGEAGGSDRIPWPAAALMSFAEGGVWSVIATFLPDRATGQSNPPAFEGWRMSPLKSVNELDEILRGRNAPKAPPPPKKIDPNAGSHLPAENDGSQAVALQDGDDLPGELFDGSESPPADRGKFFAGLAGRDLAWQVAATLAAAGMAAIYAVPAATTREEESPNDRASRAEREGSK